MTLFYNLTLSFHHQDQDLDEVRSQKGKYCTLIVEKTELVFSHILYFSETSNISFTRVSYTRIS